MLTDITAKLLTSEGFGNYTPKGVTGDIFIENAPSNPKNKIVLYQTAGFQREPKYRGKIKHPMLQIACYNESRLQCIKKLTAIIDFLDQYKYETHESVFYYSAVTEPETFPVSEGLFQGTLNFYTTEHVKHIQTP